MHWNGAWGFHSSNLLARDLMPPSHRRYSIPTSTSQGLEIPNSRHNCWKYRSLNLTKNSIVDSWATSLCEDLPHQDSAAYAHDLRTLFVRRLVRITVADDREQQGSQMGFGGQGNIVHGPALAGRYRTGTRVIKWRIRQIPHQNLYAQPAN